MIKASRKIILSILVNSVLIFSFAGCTTQKQNSTTVNSSTISDNSNTKVNSSAVKIQYLGHAAFVFSDQDKTKVGIDFWTPKIMNYAEDNPLEIGITEKDNLTKLLMSHNHEDHNYVPLGKDGAPINLSVIKGVENNTVKDNPKVDKFDNTTIGRYKAYHTADTARYNVPDDAAFLISMNNVKMLHLGDGFGTMGDKSILNKLKKKIGDIDILFLPISTSSTQKVDEETLKNTIEILNPKIIIPMHYFKIDHKTQFLSDMQKANYTVENINENYKTISKNDLKSIDKKVIWSIKPGKYSN